MNRLLLKSPLILQSAIWAPTRFILSFFLRLEIRGLGAFSRLPKGVIFAANHSSELDVVMIPASLPFLSRHMPIFYTSLTGEHYNRFGWRQMFYGGLLFKLWGAHPVRRGLQNYEKSLETHIHLINQNQSVLIFPEGKLSGAREKREAKGGVAYIAHKTNKPIIPVMIYGLSGLSFADFLLRRRKVVISFADPILPRDMLPESNEPSVDDFKAAAQKIMDGIYRRYSEEEMKLQIIGNKAYTV